MHATPSFIFLFVVGLVLQSLVMSTQHTCFYTMVLTKKVGSMNCDLIVVKRLSCEDKLVERKMIAHKVLEKAHVFAYPNRTMPCYEADKWVGQCTVTIEPLEFVEEQEKCKWIGVQKEVKCEGLGSPDLNPFTVEVPCM